MRVNRFALAVTVCAGLALLAGRVQAGGGFTSDLIEGTWFINNDPNDPNANNCFVSLGAFEGTTFETGGIVQGLGTGSEVVTVRYDALQPTSASRNTKSGKVSEGTFSSLRLTFGATVVGPVQVDKCSVSGSVNDSKSTGSVSADCKGTDVFSALTANQLASLQAAFNGNKDVKVKVNSDAQKASINIKCKGDASLD